MCGITAILTLEKPIPETAIHNMIDRLKHRGPDAQNAVTLNHCHLGHTRLSIIDLAGGIQPMSDESGRYWIVFNGEIYNYQELRQKLSEKGQHFRTNSDTEVLLKAYQTYGETALSYLNGQFAFAIWDQQEKTLFAARDRMGEKPFYYAQTPEGYLIIASEIKAILASNLINPKLDLTSLDAYLALLYVPPDRTIYENIHPLPPAHGLTWQKGHLKQWRYWQPRYSQNALQPQEAIAQVRHLIAQAVKRQMVSDVPVGAFLSGGLDSSTIIALMTQQTSKTIQTFSVGFQDLINELPYAEAVAQQYHTQHAELQMTIPVGDLLEKMALVYDEPFADSSNIPTFLIAEFARRHVKVVLSGDGGDELFGGYEWYAWLLQENPSNSEAWLKQILWRILAKVGLPVQRQRDKARLNYHINQVKRHYPDWWDRHLTLATDLHSDRGYFSQESSTTKTLIKQSYYPPDDLKEMDRASYFDLQCYLAGDILVKVDRATMAQGLESRSPFLDVDLVEFVLNLPWQLRFKESNRKYLLREAYQNLWPSSIQQRNKQGFGAPIWHWVKRPDVQSIMQRVCQPESALTHLMPGIQEKLTQFSPQQQWIILCLGLWIEKRTECLNHLP